MLLSNLVHKAKLLLVWFEKSTLILLIGLLIKYFPIGFAFPLNESQFVQRFDFFMYIPNEEEKRLLVIVITLLYAIMQIFMQIM